MGENRKLVFSEEIKKREKARQKRFITIIAFIVAIIYILLIPLYEQWNYNQIKIKSESYSNIAKDIWYNGIEDIKYSNLEIVILDDTIKYKDIYTKGIRDIGYDKINVQICIDNDLWIIQKSNVINIMNSTMKIATLKFDKDGVRIIDGSKGSCISLAIILAVMIFLLGILIDMAYTIGDEKRMAKDMKKFLKSDESIL